MYHIFKIECLFRFFLFSNIEKRDDKNVLFKFTNGSLIVTIRQGDISKEVCDAIVNPTNESMKPDGGLDAIIHQKMGEFFSDQVAAITNVMQQNACPVGQSRIFTAKFTRDPNIARFVINTVGPVYKKDEAERAAFHLQSCYYTSLALANIYALTSIAYPAISCGAFHFPPHEAAKVSIESIRQYSYHVQDVRFVLFDPQMFAIFVQEWTDYSQKINVEANVIDERPQSAIPTPLSHQPSSNYCVICKDQQISSDRQLLCNKCSDLSRSEIFNKVLQRLRAAAEKSFDALIKECGALKPLLSSYPLTYTPSQTFDQSIHKRDSVAEHYLQSHCNKRFRNLMPMAILGDGNCLYNTFVKLSGVGVTTEASSLTPIELRARNVVELVLNVKEYETKYASLSGILDNFQGYVIQEMVHDTNYAAVWDLLSISTVLNVNVMSVYPKVNGDSDMNYQNLNGAEFKPLITKDTADKSQSRIETTTTVQDVKILFSHCNKPTQLGIQKGWIPNHFVPLLSLR
jgi:O-acetyl-ADP-ribose deacetylase (regulator of RNase III)